MKREEFQKYLDLYGSDLETWPGEIRDLAQQSLTQSQEFQGLLAEAKNLDDFLQLEKVPDPSPQLAERIVGATRGLSQERLSESEKLTLGDWFRSLWRPQAAFSLALILAVGFGIGYFANLNNQTASSGTELASLLYNDEAILWETNSN